MGDRLMYPSPRHKEIQDAVRGRRRQRLMQKVFERWESTPFEKTMEDIVRGLKNFAVFELLGALANITIALSLITYLSEADERRQAQVDNAWQTIITLSGQPVGAGRYNAIEFLNSSPRRFPFFWQRWPRQPLYGLDAEGAILLNLRLDHAALYRANFQRADLTGADFSYADLTGANLRSANLESANLSNADLNGVAFMGSWLKGTNFSNSTLGLTDFSNTYLRDANFNSANLHQTILQEAIMLATDLRNARDLTQEQLTGESSPFLCNVALPDYISEVNPNRDCDVIPGIMAERFNLPLEKTQTAVEAARKKQWE